MAQKDPYSVLGIQRSADAAEVKKAYRQLAMKYHPDRNLGDETAKLRFQEVAEAYEAITNPKPAETHGSGGFSGFNGGFGADFWAQAEQTFGGGKARSASSHRPPPRQPAGDTASSAPTDWSTLFGGRTDADDLSSKFNAYAHFVNHAISFRKAAHDEQSRRQPAAGKAPRNLAVSAPEQYMAEQLFDTLTNRDSAVSLMEQVQAASGAQDIAQMEKRLETRAAAIVNALDVMAGRVDKLRYKPRDAGNTVALKL